MIRKITKITPRFDLGQTPARVNRKTGEMFINALVWHTYPKEWRVFIMLHEAAHVYLQTSNEFAADNLAFKWYAEAGLSLTQGIEALRQVLPLKNTDQIDRVIAQYDRAALFDSQVNGNRKPLQNNPFKFK